MSGGKTPDKPSDCGGTTPCPSPPNPNEESKTTGNRIDLVFDPAKSSKIAQCEKIVHIQFVQKSVDGTVIKPGDFISTWKYRDDITTDAGWGVDCLAGETSPDYQQGNGNGTKNGGTSKATMADAPKTGGGETSKYQFYDPVGNPDGAKTYRNSFATYTYCMKGKDCGKWYEGVTWEYVKTWEDQRDGKAGASTITNKNVTTSPTKEQLDAFAKFNKQNGFIPCKS
ncbi:MAG: hypothetical protein NTY19_29635 [Planctomycetota bacterium]|nr:hypothetical protein [Planctomycetota bacterium]